VLAETLARQVGETSPLFRALSPTESTGLVMVLEQQLRAVMGEGHTELVRALDPLAEDGAVASFLRSLREEDRQKQLSAALAALDANDEGSLLSRLVRETHRARQDVLAAVNADAPSSLMAILKASLTKLLQDQASPQVELAKRAGSYPARNERAARRFRAIWPRAFSCRTEGDYRRGDLVVGPSYRRDASNGGRRAGGRPRRRGRWRWRFRLGSRR
jgi:hypothetical protein